MKPTQQTPIGSELDIQHQFIELIKTNALKFDVHTHQGFPPRSATISLNSLSVDFSLHYLLNANVSRAKEIAANAKATKKTSSKPQLLIVTNLRADFLEVCRELGLSVVDLNGKALLQAPGLYVETQPLPFRKFRPADTPREIFRGKSGRIVRLLLSDRNQLWRQTALAERVGVTPALVSRVVRYLINNTIVERSPEREIRVVDHQRLVDMWIRDDANRQRFTIYRYKSLLVDPVQLAHDIAEALKNNNTTFAFTQWIAGWLRFPYTEPKIVSLYVNCLPQPGFLEAKGFVPVASQGDLWFLLPNNLDELQETQTIKGLPLVSDAQIVVDLQNTGLRGPDQANALRNWVGFCTKIEYDKS